MTSPLRHCRSEEILIEGLGQMITIEQRSMPVAARLDLWTADEHILRGALYLDPDASDTDRERALAETLAVLLFGPGAAVTARRARHLYAIP